MTPPTDAKALSRLAGIEAALRRAALRARELGQRTNTPVWVLRQGRMVDVNKPASQAS